MTSVDGLWYLADEARRRAERAYHQVTEAHGDGCLRRTHRKRVSRARFRTLADRIRRTGTPYGAHTLVRRETGELLVVRHEGVDLWVLPGGGVDGSESLRGAAERELDEEAGIDATYRGLAMANRVEISCRGCDTWGLLPVFRATAETVEPTVSDPDGEISAARWFEPTRLPEDTRDRDDLIAAARSMSVA
ncbi:NUDIX hydrolase [Natronomonas sp.]|uniref:NUDIX hydrolase n=1 Tax=Natronomonas sp. TaxID=2184060 RepID=UPI00262A2321|nr:NUDIX domain-containing protein [Natronomonas sp.]